MYRLTSYRFLFIYIRQNVGASNKRFLIGVDKQSLTRGPVIGAHILPPVMIAAVTVLTVAKTEQQYQLVMCSDTVSPIPLTAQSTLQDTTQAMSQVIVPGIAINRF